MKWLVAYLQARTVEVGDCWEWPGAPVMRHQGRPQNVRRVIAVEMQLPVEGKLATVKCANPVCCNPEHVVLLTRRQLQQRTAKLTQLHANPARARKLATKARAAGKLTEAQVAEIRAIEGVTQREIAARYGITQATVSAIRRGVKWKDYSNPWLQLMGVKQ